MPPVEPTPAILPAQRACSPVRRVHVTSPPFQQCCGRCRRPRLGQQVVDHATDWPDVVTRANGDLLVSKRPERTSSAAASDHQLSHRTCPRASLHRAAFPSRSRSAPLPPELCPRAGLKLSRNAPQWIDSAATAAASSHRGSKVPQTPSRLQEACIRSCSTRTHKLPLMPISRKRSQTLTEDRVAQMTFSRLCLLRSPSLTPPGNGCGLDGTVVVSGLTQQELLEKLMVPRDQCGSGWIPENLCAQVAEQGTCLRARGLRMSPPVYAFGGCAAGGGQGIPSRVVGHTDQPV